MGRTYKDAQYDDCEVLHGAAQYDRLNYPTVSLPEQAQIARGMERLEALVRLQNSKIGA